MPAATPAPWFAALLALATFAGTAQAGEPPVLEGLAIDEWEVPYPNTRPRDPDVAADGSIWFCGQAGAYIARFEPDTGNFTRFDLTDGAGPHNLVIDEDGFIWYAANTLPYIGRMDPASGEVTRYPMPDPAAADPHTLVFGHDGEIWFSVQRGNMIGRLSMDSGEVELVKIPIERARPYGIRVDDHGRPWATLFGSNHLATVDPADLSLQLVELPRAEARPRRLEIAADGGVWYGDYAGGRLGRYDPADGTFREWPMPGGDSARPYGSAIDDNGVLWLAEGGVPNRLVGFDTASTEVVHVGDIPAARGSVRHMVFDAERREVWFGEDTNFLARVRLP